MSLNNVVISFHWIMSRSLRICSFSFYLSLFLVIAWCDCIIFDLHNTTHIFLFERIDHEFHHFYNFNTLSPFTLELNSKRDICFQSPALHFPNFLLRKLCSHYCTRNFRQASPPLFYKIKNVIQRRYKLFWFEEQLTW